MLVKRSQTQEAVQWRAKVIRYRRMLFGAPSRKIGTPRSAARRVEMWRQHSPPNTMIGVLMVPSTPQDARTPDAF